MQKPTLEPEAIEAHELIRPISSPIQHLSPSALTNDVGPLKPTIPRSVNGPYFVLLVLSSPVVVKLSDVDSSEFDYDFCNIDKPPPVQDLPPGFN